MATKNMTTNKVWLPKSVTSQQTERQTQEAALLSTGDYRFPMLRFIMLFIFNVWFFLWLDSKWSLTHLKHHYNTYDAEYHKHCHEDAHVKVFFGWSLKNIILQASVQVRLSYTVNNTCFETVHIRQNNVLYLALPISRDRWYRWIYNIIFKVYILPNFGYCVNCLTLNIQFKVRLEWIQFLYDMSVTLLMQNVDVVRMHLWSDITIVFLANVMHSSLKITLYLYCNVTPLYKFGA